MLSSAVADREYSGTVSNDYGKQFLNVFMVILCGQGAVRTYTTECSKYLRRGMNGAMPFPSSCQTPTAEQFPLLKVIARP